MRLWTIHPRYLDAKGLVAAWREALLAQKVLAGQTRGYTRHPQLERFRAHRKPLHVIGAFLSAIAGEARRRGYQFDATKILQMKYSGRMSETDGQLRYEWTHLRRKLRLRAPQLYRDCRNISAPEPHPLFRIVPGDVRHWEKSNARRAAVHSSGGVMRRKRNSALPELPPVVNATRTPRSHGGK